MALTYYYHPLSSYCHKVLIALYENQCPFEKHLVNLGDAAVRETYYAMWPIGKMPILKDDRTGRTIPETSIIIEYLDQHFPSKNKLLPVDPDLCLQARLWDRFYDNYVHGPMQRIVADRLRSPDDRDPIAVEEARAMLHKAYGMIEKEMGGKGKDWAIGADYSLADCAASPALFYAGIIEPFTKAYPKTAAYFERLLQRPSYHRTLEEAKPFFQYFPFKDDMPSRFL